MKIEFTQRHPSGIEAGTVREVSHKFGKRMVDSKFAVVTTKDVTPSPIKEKNSPAFRIQKASLAAVEEKETEEKEDKEVNEKPKQTSKPKQTGKGKGKSKP